MHLVRTSILYDRLSEWPKTYLRQKHLCRPDQLSQPYLSQKSVALSLLDTPCRRSKMTFNCGFLIVVGLSFSPYYFHRYWKCSLNSLPLSYITYLGWGYLLNNDLLTSFAIYKEVLSNVSDVLTSSLSVLKISMTDSSTI